jgi:hypothetical protein
MHLIRPLRSGDRASWNVLWDKYLHFYRQRLPSEVTEATFERLTDGSRQPHGLIADDGGTLARRTSFIRYER